MRFLRTNTATIVTVGPFYDKTDGVTIETALTITNERISFVVDLNDGSAPTLVLDNVTGATSGTSNDLNYITNCDAGLMQLELSAANTNYHGRAFLTVTDAANHCPVFHEFMILPALVYDSIIAGTDNLQVDTIQVGGTTQTARDIGASVLLSSGTGTGQVSLSSGAVTVGTNNDKTGYSLSATTGLGNQTANITGNLSGSVGSVTGAVGSVTGNVGGSVASVTGAVGSVTGAVGSVTGNVGGNVTGSVGSLATQAKADVNAEVVDVLRTDTIPDSYSAHEALPTISQAILAIHQFLMEREVSGTSVTVQKPDGTTTAMTLTINSATDPTTVHRSA